jgi:hypothetical protein
MPGRGWQNAPFCIDKSGIVMSGVTPGKDNLGDCVRERGVTTVCANEMRVWGYGSVRARIVLANGTERVCEKLEQFQRMIERRNFHIIS